jgi:hypothetical protein
MTQEDHLGPSGSDLAAELPVLLRAHIVDRTYLFLGQSARHRGVRMLLSQLWAARPYARGNPSWAIQTDPDEAEDRFWKQREITLLNADLDEYAAILSQHME